MYTFEALENNLPSISLFFLIFSLFINSKCLECLEFYFSGNYWAPVASEGAELY